jgi:hypothetical protein
MLEFYVTQILTSTTFTFECVTRLIKVNDNNDARWKLEMELLNLVVNYSFNIKFIFTTYLLSATKRQRDRDIGVPLHQHQLRRPVSPVTSHPTTPSLFYIPSVGKRIKSTAG